MYFFSFFAGQDFVTLSDNSDHCVTRDFEFTGGGKETNLFPWRNSLFPANCVHIFLCPIRCIQYPTMSSFWVSKDIRFAKRAYLVCNDLLWPFLNLECQRLSCGIHQRIWKLIESVSRLVWSSLKNLTASGWYGNGHARTRDPTRDKTWAKSSNFTLSRVVINTKRAEIPESWINKADFK